MISLNIQEHYRSVYTAKITEWRKFSWGYSDKIDFFRT